MANSLCRLCSSTEQIVNVFHSHLENGQQLRLYILLATGIQIKETDTISKMVCHRCCEIAVKLHKYRTNAVANDKLLQEKHGVPYTPPITNQEELMRVASGMCNENVVNGTTSQDALELLNVSIKTGITSQPCVTSTSSPLPSPGQLFNTVLCNQPNSDVSCFPLRHNKSIDVHTTQVPNTKNNGALNRPQLIEPQVSTPMHSTENLKRKSPLRSFRPTAKRTVHRSIKKILTENKKLILPAKVLNSDVSPVVSLDSEDVSDWYAARLAILKRKLSSIVIKKVHDSVYYQINTPSSKSPQDNGESDAHIAVDTPNDFSEDIIKNSSKSATHKIRNCRRILDSSDSESDSMDRSELHPHESQGQDNNRVESYTKETHTAVINIPQGLHKTVYTARKRTSRKSHSTRKRASRQDDTIEVIPQKKKRIYCNKDALTPLNKIDLPQQCPSDKQAQKEIFTSSLELTRIEPLPELVDCQNILTTGKTLNIFMCPVCSLPCTSKKQLQEHQKTHLTCKYCHTTIKTIELMKKHLDESCSIRQVKDNAVVKLTRVDSLQSVVKEYPEAFQDISKPSLSLYCNENINSFKEYGINIEDAEPTIESDDVTSTAIAEKNNEEDEVVLVNNEVEVICISDDEVEYNVIPRHKIVEPPVNQVSTSVPLQPHLESISKRGFPALQKNLTEREVIRSLFKKFSDSTKKRNNSVQTFTPLNNSIKYTNSNLIVLENMFSELSVYKIPVQLESQPKISARFKEGVPTTATSTLECWVHKEPIDVIKPYSCTNNFVLPAQIPPKNTTVAPKIVAPNTATSLVTNEVPTKPNTVSDEAPKKVPIPKQKHTNNTVISSQAVSANVLDVNHGIVTNSPITNAFSAPNVLVTNSANRINGKQTCSNTSTAVGVSKSLFTQSVLKTPSNTKSVCYSNTNLTAATPSVNRSSVIVGATLINSNDALIPTTTQSSTIASGTTATSQCVSYNNSNQVQPSNFMKIVETPTTGIVQYQNGENILGVNSKIQPSNLLQLTESTPPLTYTPVCTTQNNTMGTEIQNNQVYQAPNLVYINNTVKNVNNFMLVSNNTSQLPLLTTNTQDTPVLSNGMCQKTVQASNAYLNTSQLPVLTTNTRDTPVLSNDMCQKTVQTNGIYQIPYLNTSMPAPPAYDRAVQMQRSNHINQQLSAAANMTALPAQNMGYIRVKPFYELSH